MIRCGATILNPFGRRDSDRPHAVAPGMNVGKGMRERSRITNRVVVVTGGSSGIGHATALELAKRGARLVLASRGEEALADVVEEIRSHGGEAIAVKTDVSSRAEIQALAGEAVRRYGRIDVWINNASVAVWSMIEAMSEEEVDRVISVDLLGTIFGAQAAIPVMRRQGSGMIINVGSALADRSVPLLSTYCAAKHGVKGFTESLRMEVAGDGIAVVFVLPSAINTPFYSHGRSRLGVRPDPVSVVYDPRAVARAIAATIERPRRDVYVGSVGKFLSLAQRVSPRLVDLYMMQGERMFADQISGTPDRGESNLFHSPDASDVHGEFRDRARKRSLYTEVTGSRVLPLAAGAVVAALAVYMLQRSVRDKPKEGTF